MVDQMAVMSYDTALPTDWMYSALVEWETREILANVEDDIVIFMGVPTYEEVRWNFHSNAENIKSAIRGIKSGLSHLSAAACGRVGAAVYAEWTTEPEEWKHFRKEWLGKED